MVFSDLPIDYTNMQEGEENNSFFDSLVCNAIDFLKKSVEELEKSPKYSIIHFCCALELFLKARLLAEHWTLIITDINKVNKRKQDTIRSKFEAGDFHSIGLDQCIDRLRNICGFQVHLKAIEHFKRVYNHRNKMIHFYHPGYLNSQVEIVPEQWSAWYHLHNLISRDWWEHFQKFEGEIQELHDLLSGNWKYLKAKYVEIMPDIEKERCNRVIYSKCTLCGYESAKHESLYDLIYSNTCMVCHFQKNTIHIKCPDCDAEILIEEMGVGKCYACGFETDFAFLLSALGPEKNPREDWKVAYCAECENPEPSAIPIGEYEDEFLCLHCNTLHGSGGQCHYCQELIAGIDLGTSYYSGCVMCRGASGADDS